MREEDYIILLSSQVRNFKRVNQKQYRFSCPSCGDSKKDRKAARGNLFIYKGEWTYNCYNCPESGHFSTFLRKFFPKLYDDYVFDQFNHSNKSRKSKKKDEPLKVGTVKPVFKTFTELDHLESLRDNPAHPASKYLSSRGLTKEMIDELYYTDNFKKYVNEHLIKDKFKHTDKPDPRVVIPFLNESKKILGVQGRSLDPYAYVRYVSIKIVPDEYELLYGLDKVDWSKPVFVLEGPIDAMFIPNALAYGGGSLHTVKDIPDPILVWDNEPENKEINRQIQKAINRGFRVVIWNKRNKSKDVNDMINDGIKVDAEYLLANTYQGLEAQLEFDRWKKT